VAVHLAKLACSYSELALVSKGLKVATEAFEVARSINRPFLKATALGHVAQAYLKAHARDECRTVTDLLLQTAVRAQEPPLRAYHLTQAARLYSRLGYRAIAADIAVQLTRIAQRSAPPDSLLYALQAAVAHAYNGEESEALRTVPGPSGSELRAQALLAVARAYEEDRDTARYMRLLRVFCKTCPQEPLALCQLADGLISLGRLEIAKGLLDTALQASPGSSEPVNLSTVQCELAYAHARLGATNIAQSLAENLTRWLTSHTLAGIPRQGAIRFSAACGILGMFGDAVRVASLLGDPELREEALKSLIWSAAIARRGGEAARLISQTRDPELGFPLVAIFAASARADDSSITDIMVNSLADRIEDGFTWM